MVKFDDDEKLKFSKDFVKLWVSFAKDGLENKCFENSLRNSQLLWLIIIAIYDESPYLLLFFDFFKKTTNSFLGRKFRQKMDATFKN